MSCRDGAQHAAPLREEGETQERPKTQVKNRTWGTRLGADVEFGEEEGVVEGDFAEVIVAAAGAGVTCAHVGFEEEGIGIGFEGAELGNVFGGLPIHDLAVVEGGLDEHGGVILAGEVGVGAIGLHVEIVVFLERVAPFLVLADGEGESGVEHGVEDVHKGNVADDDAEEIGAHVGDGAHEEAAGAAAFGGEDFFGSEFFGDEMAGGSDEIGEGVELVVHAAGVVPGLAEFATAADVGDGEDDAAIEKADAVGAKGNGHGEAVAAVAIEEERGAAIARSAEAIDDGEGNLRAVGSGGVETLAAVEGGVVAA